jgi:hypothetical protein
VLTQLVCLLAVILVVRSLRLGLWIAGIYAIAVLGPMVPLVMTFHLVEYVTGFTIPFWMLVFGAAAPLALTILAIGSGMRSVTVAAKNNAEAGPRGA